MQTKVRAIKHPDVFGKILYYLEIVTEVGKILINVGQKTHDTVNHITNPANLIATMPELPLTEKEIQQHITEANKTYKDEPETPQGGAKTKK